MGNLLAGANSYFDVYVWNTSQQIDFEFSQMRMMQESQAAGRQEVLAQLANVGTLATPGGGAGGGFSAVTPWGYAPAFWIGVSNFLALAAVIMIPVSIVLTIIVHLNSIGMVYAWLTYFSLFFFFFEIALYYSAAGRRQISTDRNHLYSLGLGLIVATIMAFVTYH